ncbi:MAG: hypothetical protein IKQ96_10080 [Lachnospiraceae bacterium]|nr:hypothetical protein [Lachnospiraceae bacterium]
MKLRKFLSLILASALICGLFSAAALADDNPYANPYATPETKEAEAEGGENKGDNPYDNPYDDPYSQGGPSQGGASSIVWPYATYIPRVEAGGKYTVERTKDGWLKIANEGGVLIGMSPVSGMEIITDDHYAFKDLNLNEELDPYEDWRLPYEERAQNLISLMSGPEKAAILSHGGWGNFTTETLTKDDGSFTYLIAGGRGGVTRNIARGGAAHAAWANAIQEAAEGCWYGIPAMISIDPANISGLIESVSLASTMDPELAAAIGKETSKQYRAAGVTALLGPQVDISGPTMDRAGGTYGEDPLLTLDITTAYVNAMQSSFDEEGKDLGWGYESVYCFTKHYGGAGATEDGRNDHHWSARYAVFPGNNLEAHLITYFDGVFALPGLTKSSGIMTQYSINVDGTGKPFGGEWSGAYNPYMFGLLEYAGYDSLKITDWGVFTFAGVWGAEDLPEEERIATAWLRGTELLGGYGTQEMVGKAYDKLVEMVGQEEADAIIDHAAYNYIILMMELGMFDNPYTDTAYADSICYSEESNAYGLETQRKSVVMIKNDGTIKEGGAGKEMPTVYVPYVYNTGFSVSWMGGVNPGRPSWSPSLNLEVLGKYFTVITDKPVTDEDGAITGVERASAEDIAKCDYVLVGMSNPYSVSYNKNYKNAFGYQGAYANNELVAEDDIWYPASLQYPEYTADAARDPSISGVVLEDGTRQNRTTKGVTAPAAANYGDLEALEYAASAAGDIPVIVSMRMDRGMVWTETEPLADVILVCYNKQYVDVIAEIILGKTEPTGLLVFQQPITMETVATQFEDVPRDMECYVDAAGNKYDFAFGMNWAGVIADERVTTYSAEPITKIVNIDYDAYAAAYAEANAEGEAEAETKAAAE